MKALRSVTSPLSLPKALLFVLGAVVCFHIAYSPTDFAPLHLTIVGYLICLVQLARLNTTRKAFYSGLITGLLCVAPQLTCFWRIFGPAAILLWTILALWIAVFTGLTRATLTRLGLTWTAALIPFLWTGLEYFRSELYYLKFSWMNVGYSFSGWDILSFNIFGMYGVGFVVAICAAFFLVARWHYALLATAILVWAAAFLSPGLRNNHNLSQIHMAGVQMEFPAEADIVPALDAVLAQHTNADIVVLSEYTLEGPVPDSLRNWCRKNHRFLVVGGKDPAPNNNFYDSAFVVGPEGELVFRQVKSVPIQFFKDGLPAPEQDVWNSPWGKIGFCVCYDLSYTRVIDRLIKKGAQLIIVPTMDVIDWGERQHQLHALVAPVRAAEYGVPIFRLASSGISQAVEKHGATIATAPFGGEGKTLFASLSPSVRTSLPLDRILAPVSVLITSVLILLLCLGKRRPKSVPQERDDQPKHSSETTVVG